MLKIQSFTYTGRYCSNSSPPGISYSREFYYWIRGCHLLFLQCPDMFCWITWLDTVQDRNKEIEQGVNFQPWGKFYPESPFIQLSFWPVAELPGCKMWALTCGSCRSIAGVHETEHKTALKIALFSWGGDCFPHWQCAWRPNTTG